MHEVPKDAYENYVSFWVKASYLEDKILLFVKETINLAYAFPFRIFIAFI